MNLALRHMGLGSAGFTPGIASARAAGLEASVQEYPIGDAGTALSIAVVGQKIRDGAADPGVSGWTVDVLTAAGLDGRGHPTIQAQVQAILDAVRRVTIYKPDAHGREVIQSAATTLCLRPGLCIRGGDCDDLCVLLGSCTLSVGIPTRVCKQTFNGAAQEHVLIQVQDERGRWLAADPSVSALPVGQSHGADREEYFDPMETGGAELVTIGRPDESREIVMLGSAPASEHLRFIGGRWHAWNGRAWAPSSFASSWGPPIKPSAMLGRARAQLLASSGQPSVEIVRGVPYLYVRGQGGPTVRRGWPLAARGVGKVPYVRRERPLGAFPFPSVIIEQITKAKTTWDSIAADANTCHTAPGSTPGVCPPGYITAPGGTACELTATLPDANGGTTTTTTTVPAGVAPLDDATFAAFYQSYDAFLLFYDQYSDYTTVAWTNGYVGYRDILDATYDWQNQAYAWQLKLKPICKLSAPVVDPAPAQTPSSIIGALFPPADVSAVSKILVTGAVVGAVGLALWFSWPLLSSVREGASVAAKARRAATPKTNPIRRRRRSRRR